MRSATELRGHINARRGDASVRAAALEIGINHSSLWEFLEGRDTLSVESAIKVARWLGVEPASVLVLVGHSDIAELLGAIPQPSGTSAIYLATFADAIEPLTAEHRRYVTDQAVASASELVKTYGKQSTAT